MDEMITTCVQQQNRVFESHEEFRSDIHRFMRLAKVKESHLVVFPELSGLLLAPPLAPGFKRTLLRVAERQVKKKSSLFDRMIGRAANSAADAMGGIGKSLTDAIIEHESALRDAYLTIFSDIAREYGMYVIGGSLYLPDSRDGQMHNTAYLFGPGGEIIGQQSKVNLGDIDRQFCQPAIDGLNALETDFGKLGILIGQDVLYPESGRVLASNGALFVANLLAATDSLTYLKARQALATRVQENLMLGAQSCLVGKNILGQNLGNYVGKSSILAPMELTTRYSGSLGEVGTTISESIISATWDIKGLYELRNSMDTPTYLVPDDEALLTQLQDLYGHSEKHEAIVSTPPHSIAATPLIAEPTAPLLIEEHPEPGVISLPPPTEQLQMSPEDERQDTPSEVPDHQDVIPLGPALEAADETEMESEPFVGDEEAGKLTFDSVEPLPDTASASWSWPPESANEDELTVEVTDDQEQEPAPGPGQDPESNRFWWTDQDADDQGETAPIIDMDLPDSAIDAWDGVLAPETESGISTDTADTAETDAYSKLWDDDNRDFSAEDPLISSMSRDEQTGTDIQEFSTNDVPDAEESEILLQDPLEYGRSEVETEEPNDNSPDDDENTESSLGRFRSWLRR